MNQPATQIIVGDKIRDLLTCKNGTIMFYTASVSGGSPTTLNTVVIENGVIVSWTQA